MGAPKGNNYWEFRNKHGRDFLYTPDALWDEAVKYFEWMQSKVWNKKEAIKSGQMVGELVDVPTQTPMSLKSFCLFADISHDTFTEYDKGEGTYKDFPVVTKKIKSIIESQQFEGATVGAYNPNIIARTLGLTDRSDITTNGKDLPSTTINLSNLSNETLKDLENNL